MRRCSHHWLAIALAFLFVSMRIANAHVETEEQAAAEQSMFADERAMQILSQQPGANDTATLHQLATVMIGPVTWANTTAEAAVADLSAKVKWGDPLHVGIKFVVRFTPNPNQANAITFNLGNTHSVDLPLTNNVCIVTKEPTSALALLYMIGEQTNLSFQAQKGIVTMKPWEPGAILCLPMMPE